jgi:hypothetical protein
LRSIGKNATVWCDGITQNGDCYDPRPRDHVECNLWKPAPKCAAGI